MSVDERKREKAIAEQNGEDGGIGGGIEKDRLAG